MYKNIVDFLPLNLMSVSSLETHSHTEWSVSSGGPRSTRREYGRGTGAWL